MTQNKIHQFFRKDISSQMLAVAILNLNNNTKIPFNYLRLYKFTSIADRTKLIMDRGRSVDPELVLPRQRYSHSSLPRQQKRAQSAAPNAIRLSQLYNDQGEGYSTNMSSTLPKSTERALINQHVNPYQEFPSLR